MKPSLAFLCAPRDLVAAGAQHMTSERWRQKTRARGGPKAVRWLGGQRCPSIPSGV